MTAGGLAALGLVVAFRVRLAWPVRQPLASVLLHPVTVIATPEPCSRTCTTPSAADLATRRGRPYEEPNP